LPSQLIDRPINKQVDQCVVFLQVGRQARGIYAVSGAADDGID
jgi:hypothetical protein